MIDIVPGESLAGIKLDDDLNDVIKSLSNRFDIEITDGVALLDGGLITIGYEDNGSIYCVMCNEKFEGRYQNKLWAGMSVADVLNHSHDQIAFDGCVVVDGINGIGLPLPEELDDFEKITDFLPLDFVFKSLSVFRI